MTDLPRGLGIAVIEVGDEPTLALWDGVRFRDASSIGRSFDDFATLPRADLQAAVRNAMRGREIDHHGRIRAPIGTQEVWAAGVTYRRSEEARVEESMVADVYARVYRAERPELFFKSPGWRVVGTADAIGIRADSEWNVPEPELAILIAPDGELRAFACANDQSSRSIEGENPLYLPQAKVYDRSCALGPVAVPAWLVDPLGLTVHLFVHRAGREVFRGQTQVSAIVRPLESLAEYLLRAYTLPAGAWLLTGTGVVPPAEFTLEPGDEVVIQIDSLGTLRNAVVRVNSG